MELKLFIGKEHTEEVIIYAREKNSLVENIERLILNHNDRFIGYNERGSMPLELEDIYCFIVEKGKIFALTEKDRFVVKSRLYQVEERLPDTFIKINQSSIINSEKIERFEASFSGALCIKLKNGYTDYISRRNLKNVKERLGF